MNPVNNYFKKEYMHIPREEGKIIPFEVRNFSKTEEVAFKGVKSYIQKSLSIKEITPIVNEYIHPEKMPLKAACLKIQQNWGSFIKWVKSTHLKGNIL